MFVGGRSPGSIIAIEYSICLSPCHAKCGHVRLAEFLYRLARGAGKPSARLLSNPSLAWVCAVHLAIIALLFNIYYGGVVMRSGAYNEIGSKTCHYGVPFCSLEYNELGAEGGKAVAEALKVNTSITNIK